jgi:hypothetical protein
MISFAIPLVGLGAAVFYYHHEQSAALRRAENELRSRLAASASDQAAPLTLYDTRDTDRLLQSVSGSPLVRGLRLEMTDVSDDGMIFVKTFPNLQTLVIYGGRPGVGDAGLELLKDCPIRQLSLVNTLVTDRGLGQLAAFGKLESLTVFQDSVNRLQLTDEALVSLAQCRQLKELRLGGHWYSDQAIAELRRRLPKCSISKTKSWSF